MPARLVATAPGTTVTARPARWAAMQGPKLLLAEAFVSGGGNPCRRAADLTILVPRVRRPVRPAPPPFNLLAAAALWLGPAFLRDELHTDVLVLRAQPPKAGGGRTDEAAAG